VKGKFNSLDSGCFIVFVFVGELLLRGFVAVTNRLMTRQIHDHAFHWIEDVLFSFFFVQRIEDVLLFDVFSYQKKKKTFLFHS